MLICIFRHHMYRETESLWVYTLCCISGTTCTDRLNPCESKPCGNKECVAELAQNANNRGYSCNCFFGEIAAFGNCFGMCKFFAVIKLYKIIPNICHQNGIPSLYYGS